MNEQTRTLEATARPLQARQGRPYTAEQDERAEPMTGTGNKPTAASGRSRRERFTRTERILITAFIAMFTAQLGATAAAFMAINGQLVNLQEQIGALRSETHKEIGALRVEMHQEIGAVRAEIGALRAEMHREIGALRSEMRKEIQALSERIARIETHLFPQSDDPDPSAS